MLVDAVVARTGAVVEGAARGLSYRVFVAVRFRSTRPKRTPLGHRVEALSLARRHAAHDVQARTMRAKQMAPIARCRFPCHM